MPPAPPGGPKTETLAKFGAEFDYSQVASEIRKMATDWGKRMRAIEKTSERSMKGTFKHFHEFNWKVTKARKAYHKLYEEQLKKELFGLKSLHKSNTKNRQDIRQMTGDVRQLEKAWKAATRPMEKAELGKSLEIARGKLQKLVDQSKEISGHMEDIHEGSGEIKEKFTFDPKELHQEALDVGEELGEIIATPLKAVLSKDLPHMAKTAGKILGRLTHAAGSGLGGLGAKMSAPGGGGGAMGGMGKVLGELSNTLKSLGPILTMTAGLLASIVAILVDAEAEAKAFNKEILSTSSTAGFLKDSFGNADLAAEKLDKTMKAVRDAANDLTENVKWGISKEEHKAVLNALTQEGASIVRLTHQYEALGGKVDDANKLQEFYAKTVHEAVTYSRAFGVSLQEIGQFEGELMTDLGADLTSVQKSFKTMEKGALESGIASNKFFAIIRGISGDLNLYNLRLDDTVHMLTMLGKVMSPRNAQQFLTATMTAVKGMDWTSRVKTGMLTKGKDVGILKSDYERSVRALADQIGKALGKPAKQYEDAIRKGGDDFQDVIDSLPDEMKSSIREAQLQVMMKGKMARGGVVGRGIALGETSAPAQFETMVDSIKAFNGGKPLIDTINSVAVQAMAAQQGWNEDQLQAAAKAELSFETQRKVLKEGFKKNDQTIKDKLAKVLGHEIKDASEIDAMHYDEIAATLDDGNGAQADSDKAEKEYAKHIGSMTNSLVDKLSMLTDFVMNQIYDVMSSIYDWLVKHFGGDKENRMRALSEKAAKSRNADLLKAIEESGQDPDEFKGALLKDIGPKFDSFLDETSKQAKDLREQLKNETDPKKKAELQKKLDATMDRRHKLSSTIMGAMGGDLHKMLDALGAARGSKNPRIEKAYEALHEYLRLQESKAKGENVSADDIAKAEKKYLAARNHLSGSNDAMNELMRKGIWTLTPEQLEDAFPDIGEQITQAAPDLPDATKKAVTRGSIYVHDTHAEKIFRTRGIKLDKPFVETVFKKVMHDAVYEAAGDALYDYWVLTSRGTTQNWSDWFNAQGASGSAAMKAAGDWARNSSAIARPSLATGMVARTPVTGPTANQVIELRLKGDLSRIIDARAQNQIAEHERMRNKR